MSIFDAADTGQGEPLAGFQQTILTEGQQALIRDMEAVPRSAGPTPRHVRRARGKAQRRARKMQRAKARAQR